MSDVELPDIVDYPEFYNVDEYKDSFLGKFCYIMEPYDLDGISLYIGFRDGHVFTRIGDFKSNVYDLEQLEQEGIHKFVIEQHSKIVNILSVSKISNALLYFSGKSDDLILVDMMINANKFVGPGMLRDIFGKVIKTQNVVTIDTITNDALIKYKGKYIKPSAFKYVIDDNNIPRPLYGIIK